MTLMQKLLQREAHTAPNDSIMRIAYKSGAEVSWEPILGEFSPGKLSDTVLLRQDRAENLPWLNHSANLVYLLGTADVDTVICNGRLLLHHDQHLAINEGEGKKEVEQRLGRLVQRVAGRKGAGFPT